MSRKVPDELNLRMNARVEGGNGTGPVRRKRCAFAGRRGVRQYVDPFLGVPPDRGGDGAARARLLL